MRLKVPRLTLAGIHWASTIPAFLALACLPFPFLFYKYGAAIRVHCKYAAQADAFIKKLRGQTPPSNEGSDHEDEVDIEKEEDAEQEAADYSFEKENEPQFEKIKTGHSTRSHMVQEFPDNPYDIDRVNTRESFRSNHSRHSSRK